VVVPQETAAGDEVQIPPTEFQVPLPPITDLLQRVPLLSTTKMLLCPLANEVLAAGPVVPMLIPLALAALLTTAKRETSTMAAIAILTTEYL
jgi:hypothetical protein